MRLAKALDLLAALRKQLRFSNQRPRLITVGSIRRGEPTAADLDLLVVVPDQADFRNTLATAYLRDSPYVITGDRGSGARRRSLVITGPGVRAFQVDLFLVRRQELPFALFHYTGSRQYNIRTRAHAKARGWLLNQYGLFYADRVNTRVRGTSHLSTERELAAVLGVSYRPPTDRSK
jgi:DNA polymerase (family 10)